LAKVVGLAPNPAAVAAEGVAAPVLPAVAPAGRGSSVLVFLLGLIPGLGAIYNGEYNKALLHIVIFAGIILGITLDLGEGAEAVLICALAVFPFYMAIDAVRTLKAKQIGENYQDPLENWTKQRGFGPILLIALGGLFLLRNFGVFDVFRIRELFFPLILIGIGVWLLRNRMGRQG
jgi:hypothetical protein